MTVRPRSVVFNLCAGWELGVERHFFLYQGNHPGVTCGIVTFPVCRSLASLSSAEAQREFWEEEYKRNKCAGVINVRGRFLVSCACTNPAQ